MAEAAAAVRMDFWQDGAIPEDAHSTLNMSERIDADAVTRILITLGRVPEDPLAIAAFTRASKTLVAWWNVDDDPERRSDRTFHTVRLVALYSLVLLVERHNA